MAEIDKLLSGEAKKDMTFYKKFLSGIIGQYTKLNELITGNAKALDAVGDKAKKTEKSQKNLDDLTREGNKLLGERNSLVARRDKKLEEITKQTIKLKDAEKKRLAVLKEEITGEKKAAEAKKKAIATTKLKIVEDKKAATAIKLKAAAEKKAAIETKKTAIASEKAAKKAEEQNRAYKKLSKQHIELRNKAKDLAVTYGEGSKQARKAAAAANVLDKRLKKIDATVGQSQRKVGGYFGAIIKGAIAAGIAFLTFRTVFNVFKNSINILANFEEAMSKVKAVAGATPKEFKALTADAKRLGSTTSKTATQVSALQLSFSKLGFSTKEILNATEATISLSIAAGSDLAESATVAASTLRAFGLDAIETQRVVDVMAKSFASSGLDLEKFKESMKLVAPIARAANIDLETTTALLSNLADSGLAGSIAGTGLKNVISKLANENSALSKELGFVVKNSDDLIRAFKVLKERNIDLTEATELTDERSKAAFLTMVEGIDTIEGLKKAYDGAIGSAKDMAKIMEDNLIKDVNKLSSAWEGFILNLNKGEGKLTQFFRDAVQLVTKLVGAIDGLNKSEKQREAEGIQAQINQEMDVYIQKIQAAIRAEEDLTDVRVFKNKLIDEQIATEEKLFEVAKARLKGEDRERTIKFYNGYIAKLKELKSVIPSVVEEVDDLAASIKGFAEIEDPEFDLEFDLDKINKDAKKSAEDIGKWNDDRIKKGKEEEQDLNDFLSDLVKKRDTENQWLADQDLERRNKDLADAEIAAKKKKEIQQQFAQTLIDGGNVLFDLAQSQRDRELEGVRSTFNARIQAAEGNKELQERLTKELAIKEAEIQRKQAQSEQNQAVFNILAVQTPQNIAKVFPNPILMAAAAAIGFIQAGIVKSAPLPEIPEFFKGTTDSPFTFIAGDGPGANTRELIYKQDGSIELSPNSPTLYSGKEYQHATVLSNPKTEKMLSHQTSATDKILNRKIDKLIGAVENSNTNIHFSRNVGKLNRTHFNRKHKKNV